MIELKKIIKSYDDNIVLSDFSYLFESGKSYALTGKSGSGKSTLLNIIGRLETPDSGEILINGQKITEISERFYFSSHLGYLFQNYGLIDNESILENLTLAFVGRSENKSQRKLIITETLKKVGLANYPLERKIFSLSGGEAQRVAIAKLLIKKPPIILADEPTGSLDKDTGEEIITLLLETLSESSLVIIATHDKHVYQRVDSIININKI